MINEGDFNYKTKLLYSFYYYVDIDGNENFFGWVGLPNYKRHVNWSTTCVFTDIGKLLSFKLQPGVQNNVI